MSAFTEFLVLLVCLCLTNIATGDTITVNFMINSDNPNCVGGQVGLTNTSILVHYRLYETTPPVEEWTFLSEIHISEDEQIVHPVIFTNISATGVQLRFLQLEHGGEGCNCWNVTNIDIIVIEGFQTLILVSILDVTTSYCHLSGLATITTGGQEEERMFCSGSASEARGVITPVVYYRNSSDICPGNSSDYLIAPKGRLLPENCSSTNPRM